ncbi:metallophosphoesterase family protein [Mycoplasmopsis primatum]|uniref:metallophosphoesterase family protein n=1 Tax=Mycoplasmopsis primatum TaxID=55604 RepID=UPI0004956F05|nr:metallophosphoesterase [Mycoplasmopsis primatum]
MKIIHTADIHFGSKIENKFDYQRSKIRQSEIKETFKRMIDYAKNNDIQHIILAGDIFDNQNPRQEDRDYFYDLIEHNSNIVFYYLRGNHDLYEMETEKNPFDNLKRFSRNFFKSYDASDNVVISGIEIGINNLNSPDLRLNKEKINIVVLHGDIQNNTDRYYINIKSLQNKNIDYLALGHIHNAYGGILDDRGIFQYSGCLEPRGFDEIGKKGFYVINIENKKVNHEFIPFSKRTIDVKEIDVTGLSKALEIYHKIKTEVEIKKENIYRFILTGTSSVDLNKITDDVKNYFNNDCFLVDIKNATKPFIDYAQYNNDLTLVGNFIKVVKNDPTLSEDEKQEIIQIGITALKGENIS